MRLLLLLITTFSLGYALNFEIQESEVANGKTVLIEFFKEKNIEYKNLTLKKQKFAIFQNPNDKERLYSLVPIDYYQKPTKSLKLKLHYAKNTKEQSKTLVLKIKDGAYAKESIQVSASKVNPTAKDVQERIAKEYNEAMKIYNSVTPTNYIKSAFIFPLESKITSDFGKARLYNGSHKGYHSGTDFRAAVGTPVVAANDAKVVLVKERFYSGGTVILDHGHGLYTCYFHMSRFDVKQGEIVQKGTQLGLSGKSGRVSGPHLHFSARIKGVQVDPMQLITLLNNTILKRES